MEKIIAIAVLALAAVIAWFFSAKHRSAARRKAIKALSATVNCSREMEDYGPAPAMLEGTVLPFFLEARKGVGKNLLRFAEDDGFEAYLFDYVCQTGPAGKEAWNECTAALFDMKKDLFPAFVLSIDGSATPPQTAGFDPLDVNAFPGLPPGAKLYGSEPARLGAMLTVGKNAAFAAEPDWCVQASGQYLLLYKEGRLVSTGAYHGFVESTRKIARQLLA